MVQPYNSTYTINAWKTSCFLLSERSDFSMIDNLSIPVHALPMCLLTSLSVDEILLPKYVNWFINFRGFPSNEEMAPFWTKIHEFCFIWVYAETSATFCPLHAMQQRFGLSWSKKSKIICIVCINNSFCGISVASCVSFSFMRSIDVRSALTWQIMNRNADNISEMAPFWLKQTAFSNFE